MRKAALIVVFTFLVSSGTALSLGSFVSEQDVRVEGNSASFTISVFNLADESMKLRIESSGAGDTEVIHPSSMTLEPATVTSNPDRGGNWFLMTDGRYVEVEEIPVEHFRGGSGSSQYSFDISLTASPLDSSSDSSSQKIAQTRSYSFDVEYVGTPDETSSDTGGEGSVDDEASEDSSFSDTVSRSLPDLGNVGGSIERVFNGGDSNSQDNSQEGSGGQDGGEESGSENNQGSSEEDSETKSESESSTSTSGEETDRASQNQSGLTGNFAGGANGITVVLLIALSMSALYLFKVM